jgi:ParB/RepB/Spo0J family partition protein
MKDILSEIKKVKVADIKVGLENMRGRADALYEIQALMDSIKEHGLLQPVILKGTSASVPPYDLIAGSRRFVAHQKLGCKYIYTVFAGDVSQTQASVLSLAENMHRREPSYEDVTRAVTALYERMGHDDRKVADALDIPLRTVRDHLHLDTIATPEIKKMLATHQISRTDAKRALEAAQGNVDKANALAKKIVNLTRSAKIRLKEYGLAHKDADADKIVAEAKTPKIREQLVLSLTAQVHSALAKAATAMELDPEEVAKKAVEEWLATNGYLHAGVP